MSRCATKNLSWGEWLTAWFGRPLKRDKPDLQFAGPNASDRRLLYAMFTMKGTDEEGRNTRPSLVEELEARGYDIMTLEFRIWRKPKDEDR